MTEKRAFLFANGELKQTAWLKEILSAADFLIAVDGGLNYLQSLDLAPQLLIGDLDSVNAEQVQWAKALGASVEKFPIAKNETDLELALLAAHRLGYRELVVVAGLGGRLDQTLGNLSLLRLPELHDCQVRFEDGDEELFLIRSETELHGASGDIVSLLPLWEEVTGVLTEELLYPLRRETLYPERTRGISNVMISSKARVSITTGQLLCIHTHSNQTSKEKHP